MGKYRALESEVNQYLVAEIGILIGDTGGRKVNSKDLVVVVARVSVAERVKVWVPSVKPLSLKSTSICPFTYL